MKKFFGIFAIFSTLGISAMAGSIEGRWESVTCSPWNDSSASGTYNIVFNPSGTVETHIQFYNNMRCEARLGVSPIQAQGTYQVDVISKVGDADVYHMKVKYRHLSYNLNFEARVAGDHMELCRRDRRADQCSRYQRR